MAMNDKTFSEALTFTRASTKWVWNGTGKLVEVPVDQPAYDHDPVTGEALGVLIEPGATNEMTYSGAIGPTRYSAGRGTEWTENYAIAPDGTNTATRIKPVSGLVDPGAKAYSVNAYRGHPVSSGEVVTISVFVKPIGTKSHYVGNPDGADAELDVILFVRSDVSGGSLQVNLATMAVAGIPSGSSSTITPCHDGWYRISHTYEASADDSINNTFIGLSNRTSMTSFDPYPSGEEEVLVWGMQVEKGPVATSYIPTAGAAVTRAADNMSRALGAEFKSDGFTVVSEFYLSWQLAEHRRLFHFTGGSVTQRLSAYISNDGSLGVVLNGAFANPTISATTATGRNKAAVVASGQEVLAALNGVYGQGANDRDVGSTTVLRIGSYGTNSQFLNAHIKALRYYPRAMTADELEALTTL